MNDRMTRHVFLLLSLLLAAWQGVGQELPEVEIEILSTGLDDPVCIACPEDGSNRLFVVERTGKIRIYSTEHGFFTGVLLDLGAEGLDRITTAHLELGLLSMACHPDFADNGRFFLYYTRHPEGATAPLAAESVLAEYVISATDSNVSSATETILLGPILQPTVTDNAGHIVFDSTGHLFLSLGHGGRPQLGHGQNINTLLGSLLRLDIDSAMEGYSIPSDNPFIGSGSPEIYAYGLRNPWRFSFDEATDRLFLADVGRDRKEEINLIERGKNYGWPIMEGTLCHSPMTECASEGLSLPIWECDHDYCRCIIGGLVYRGSRIPGLSGAYVFADWSFMRIMALVESATGEWEESPLGNVPGNRRPTSFGTDEEGEIYLTAAIPSNSNTGYLLKIEGVPPPTPTRTATATSPPTSTPTMIPTATITPSPSRSPTPPATPTETASPTNTLRSPADFDVAPVPPDRRVDALDLLGIIRSGSTEERYFLDFARFWTHQTESKE